MLRDRYGLSVPTSSRLQERIAEARAAAAAARSLAPAASRREHRHVEALALAMDEMAAFARGDDDGAEALLARRLDRSPTVAMRRPG